MDKEREGVGRGERQGNRQVRERQGRGMNGQLKQWIKNQKWNRKLLNEIIQLHTSPCLKQLKDEKHLEPKGKNSMNGLISRFVLVHIEQDQNVFVAGFTYQLGVNLSSFKVSLDVEFVNCKQIREVLDGLIPLSANKRM